MGDGGGADPIRVVIADDDPAVTDYLRLALSLEDGDFEVVGVAADAGSAVDVVGELEPDVLLLDLRMPGGGVAAAQLVGSLTPATRVLVFTADDEGSELLALLRSGIAGYLTKSASSEDVIEAVRAVAEGGQRFVPAIAAKAFGELTSRLHAERGDQLRVEQAQRRIDRAIRQQAFRMVLQPVFDLATGEPQGAEALARFTGPPQRPPDQWFAEAELVDRRIDLEVAAARAALALRPSLDGGLWLSINLSPTAVLSGEIDRLFAGVDLENIVVELTEHAEVDDYGFLNLTLDRWRDRGLRVAVDDAGGGYASFAHVVNARPDFIKLDRSLTVDIDVVPRKRALAAAICEFAAEVGVHLIAEGIEAPTQLELLTDLGVSLGQGYHLGVPAALEEQPALVAAGGRGDHPAGRGH